jgi:hypothetical protein
VRPLFVWFEFGPHNVDLFIAPLRTRPERGSSLGSGECDASPRLLLGEVARLAEGPAEEWPKMSGVERDDLRLPLSGADRSLGAALVAGVQHPDQAAGAS